MIFNSIVLFYSLTVFAFYDGQNRTLPAIKFELPAGKPFGTVVSQLGKNIDCMFQDRENNYWFASNGEGVYRFDGKTILHFTDNDGLCSNFVFSIQEDSAGNLWFTTRDGICRFDGASFTNFTVAMKNAPAGKVQYSKGGLFFGHPDGMCYFNGMSFTYFAIHPDTYTPEKSSMNRPYGVYSTLADKSGTVWFGTQEKGVCRYDGKTFSYIAGKGLDGPAVRSIFQDRAGNLWFGNNGTGLFRYDGKTLTNFTEEKGLGNPEFLKKRQVIDKPGTLARVFAINEDRDGNLWIGTIDAGVWKYDGTNLTNYTIKEGLTGNAVWAMYKDKKGELWFVTNGDAVCKFNGKTFTQFAFN